MSLENIDKEPSSEHLNNDIETQPGISGDSVFESSSNVEDNSINVVEDVSTEHVSLDTDSTPGAMEDSNIDESNESSRKEQTEDATDDNVSDNIEAPQDNMLENEQESLTEDATRNSEDMTERETLGESESKEDKLGHDLFASVNESLEIDEDEPEVDDEPETFDDDDDFGSFDEASFEEFQATDFEAPASEPRSNLKDSIESVLDSIFTENSLPQIPKSGELLSEQAQTYLQNLSKPPRLNPHNWVKSNLRHSLLLKLGIPINLDELERPLNYQMSKVNIHQRKKSISEHDIDWSNIEIPDAEKLQVSAEEQQSLLTSTEDILSSIERANMTNTSEAYLQNCAPEVLDAKMAELKKNYDQLLTLSSLWREQLKELRSSQEIYEAVVQDYVGYKQKVQRNEMLEGLSRSKTKKGKRTF